MIQNPQTPAEWAQMKIDFDREILMVSAFLVKYGRGCKRCATTAATLYAAFTPKTFNNVSRTMDPLWEMVVTGHEDFATDLLDAIGAEVYCAKCVRQTPKNGAWSAILEARMNETMEKEILNGE